MRRLGALNFLCIYRQENIKFGSSINWSKNGLSEEILIGMLLTIQPRFLEQNEAVKVELYFHIRPSLCGRFHTHSHDNGESELSAGELATLR